MEPHQIILCLVLIAALFQTGHGFSCYQCNSTLDHNCQEYFDHKNPNQLLKAKPCKMQDAKFCIKVTGLWGGIVGTHRFCSSRDMGYQCQDMRFPDHSRKYRGCVYTCSWEGCNTGAIQASTTAVMMSLFVTLASALWRLVS